MDSRNSPNEIDVARHEIVLRARQMIADGLGLGAPATSVCESAT